MRVRHRRGRLVFGFLAAVAAAAFAGSVGRFSGSAGEARLVAFEALPEYAGESCDWEVATPQRPSFAPTGAFSSFTPDAASRQDVSGRQPLHFIQDPYPSFSSIAVDPV